MPARAFDEVDEQKGLVYLGEVVVEQDGVRLLFLVLERLVQDRRKDRAHRRRLPEKADEAPSLADSLGGLLDAPYVPAHHLAHRVSDVASRKCVVAHVRDAVRSE